MRWKHWKGATGLAKIIRTSPVAIAQPLKWLGWHLYTSFSRWKSYFHSCSVSSGHLVMAAAPWSLLAAVLLLISSGLHCSAPQPACPEPCDCQRASLLNCSSSGLSAVPRPIQDSISELDLSHNLLGSVAFDRPHRNLRTVWLGGNNIEHLSLCVESSGGGGARRLRRFKAWNRRGCVSWAPSLRMLSVERNQLHQLPTGESGQHAHAVSETLFQNVKSHCMQRA